MHSPRHATIDEFEAIWVRALRFAERQLQFDGRGRFRQFDVAVLVGLTDVRPMTSGTRDSSETQAFRAALRRVMSREQAVAATAASEPHRECAWIQVNHHAAHALSGFYDSPFDSAIILSLDAGGTDGYFNVFYASRSNAGRLWPHHDREGLLWHGDTPSSGVVHRALGIRALHWLREYRINAGGAYETVARGIKEVVNDGCDPQVVDCPHCFHRSGSSSPCAHLAGSMMGYAVLGAARPQWLTALEQKYRTMMLPYDKDMAVQNYQSVLPHAMTWM